jgi:signal transduction histidine kinase
MSAVRQAVTVTLAFLLLIAVAGTIAIAAFERETQRRIEDGLYSRFAVVRDDINRLGFDAARYPETKNERVELRPSAPEIAPGLHNFLRLEWGWGHTKTTRSNALLKGYEDWVYMVGKVPDGQLIVGTNLSRQDDFLQIMLQTMGLIGVGAALSALLLGIYLGTRTQRRINAMSQALTRFGAGDLSARVGGILRNDDLGDLSRQLNATLEQLDVLIRQSRDFASNIAHDLRTPLSRLRIRLDRAVMAIEDGGDSAGAIESAIAQTDQIIAIFNAFLRIAKLEARTARATFTSVELGQLVEEIFETYRIVVEESGRILKLDKRNPAAVPGDPVLLTQAIANLIENAIRHTPAGTEICLLAHGGTIGVADTGAGIPVTERDRVTQPLYRLERSRTSEGIGLGLALVKTIASLHDAELSLSEHTHHMENKGLLVTMALPRKNHRFSKTG